MRHMLFAAVLAACSSSPKPAPVDPAQAPVAPHDAVAERRPAPPAVPERVLAEDTPMTDHDGNAFIAPAEWKVSTGDAVTLLTAPEGDSHVAIVDVTAPSNEAARDAAWQAYRGA